MKLEWKTCFKVAVSIFLLYICIYYWHGVVELFTSVLSAASPLLIGCAVAYIINILMTFYERYYFPKTQKNFFIKSRRIVCMIFAILTLFAIIILIVRLVFPELISCVKLIFSSLPGAINSIIKTLEKWDILPEDIMAALNSIDWKSKISEIANVLTSGVSNLMDIVISTLTSVFSGVVTAFLSLIFSIYLLLGKETLKRQSNRVMKHYIPEKLYNKIIYTLDILNDCFHRYIVGQCTEAVILGLLCTLGMAILRLPYATMIGALIAFTALIPVAGAYIGGVVGALMIFSVSPIKAVVFVVYLVILQQFEGNVIYPRVVGSSMGLPGIWVLAAVTIGGGMMGVLGMLLGVPIAATLYRLLKNNLNKGTTV